MVKSGNSPGFLQELQNGEDTRGFLGRQTRGSNPLDHLLQAQGKHPAPVPDPGFQGLEGFPAGLAGGFLGENGLYQGVERIATGAFRNSIGLPQSIGDPAGFSPKTDLFPSGIAGRTDVPGRGWRFPGWLHRGGSLVRAGPHM